MIINNNNYFSQEAGAEYWSVSQFKAFDRCEASGLAEARGEYARPETDALLIGSYVDAYFTGDVEQFQLEHAGEMFTKKGELYSKFQNADKMIEAVEKQPLLEEYLTGDKQVIKTAELFGVPWKIRMDVCNGERIVDLKTVRDFGEIWEDGYGRRPWIEYWGYDIQGAVYQKIEQAASGRDKPLPFFIAAVTKEKTPDVALIQIPQETLDVALRLVEAKIERFDLIKSGDVEPIRCESCEYCKQTKVLKKPSTYRREEE